MYFSKEKSYTERVWVINLGIELIFELGDHLILKPRSLLTTPHWLPMVKLRYLVKGLEADKPTETNSVVVFSLVAKRIKTRYASFYFSSYQNWFLLISLTKQNLPVWEPCFARSRCWFQVFVYIGKYFLLLIGNGKSFH